ncbi:hypothetical protein [Methanococcus voltae]|uniref:Uncharacterized protein n=1 Tax=Methanococcus voltae PS TaxID=523842 RepID=A0ABT2EVF8_METVO|nr:hypothetical protein [Methanococcus voltae]MBP2173118.1 hypothetical protein [Methanococcus voltae]MCS3921944.1 hypothetical protein [Methanococcus voltae PS]
MNNLTAFKIIKNVANYYKDFLEISERNGELKIKTKDMGEVSGNTKRDIG